jgi:hypothetical protein
MPATEKETSEIFPPASRINHSWSPNANQGLAFASVQSLSNLSGNTQVQVSFDSQSTLFGKVVKHRNTAFWWNK